MSNTEHQTNREQCKKIVEEQEKAVCLKWNFARGTIYQLSNWVTIRA